MALAFLLLPEPQPAVEELLPRQSLVSGGAATRPPFRPDRAADRDVARAVADLHSRQHATLSRVATVGRAGESSSGGGGEPQQPGSSRLARSLSAVKDSLAASWLWNAPDPGESRPVRGGCNALRGNRRKGARKHAQTTSCNLPTNFPPCLPLQMSCSRTTGAARGTWPAALGATCPPAERKAERCSC